MSEPTTPKPVLKSKTIIVNLVIAVAALVPSVQTFIQEHPAVVLSGLAAINVALRFVTKGRLILFPD